MPMYISLDAGGSKCNAIMFDDELNLVGKGLSGGVNITQTSIEDSRSNVDICLKQLFEKGNPSYIDRVYATFVGPSHVLKEGLAKYTTVKEIVFISESVGGLMAGAIREEGILVISGTGSDVFYVTKLAKPERMGVVGGWGPILGDEGSGTWIGQQALQAVVKAIDGWGEQTILRDLVKEEWKIDDYWDIVHVIHSAPAPFRKVASITHLVGKAANLGDEVAINILKEAGTLLATQVICLMDKNEIPDEHREITCCGGAWKTHPLMFETFAEKILQKEKNDKIHKPWFEHLMAGVAIYLKNNNFNRNQILNILNEKFPDYRIKW